MLVRAHTTPILILPNNLPAPPSYWRDNPLPFPAKSKPFHRRFSPASHVPGLGSPQTPDYDDGGLDFPTNCSWFT